MTRFALLILAVALCACTDEPTVERIVKVFPNGNPERSVVYDASETEVLGEKYFYDHGSMRIEGPVKEGKRHGEWKSYTMDGSLLSINNYDLGNYHGPYFNYFPSGEIRIEGAYDQGAEIGEWIIFDEKGKRSGLYRNFDEAGELREKGAYQNDKKVGVWEVYDADGLLLSTEKH